MKSHKTLLIGMFILASAAFLSIRAQDLSDHKSSGQEPDRLLILWTSGDKEVAQKMVHMYAYSAKKNGWWKDLRFVVWGPSSLLLSKDKDLQDSIRKMMEVGVEVFACKACADMYGVSDELKDIGINVKYMGKDLTDWLKSGWPTLTF